MRWMYLITMSDNREVLLTSEYELDNVEIAHIILTERDLYVLRYLTKIVHDDERRTTELVPNKYR